MKRGTVLLAGAVVAATLLSAALPLARVLVWNATASVPTGLYLIRAASELHAGQRVAIDPSPALRRYLAARGYLPAGVPLLKEIAGVRGDIVCRDGADITLNGELVAAARAIDRRGRPLPVWRGCRTIAEDQVFVMNRHAPGSFDGRYFGPVSRHRIIGRAKPLWTDETGSGEHIWFARTSDFRISFDHQQGDER
jgi:conjugative transfer signal peptidase TraF